MESLNNLLFLQVRGRSQLAKELEETKKLREEGKEVLFFDQTMDPQDVDESSKRINKAADQNSYSLSPD